MQSLIFLRTFNLDKELTGKEKAGDLKNLPKLTSYLSHCTRERNYFLSVKKCGKVEYTTCQPIRLPSDVFEQLYHLTDSMPDPVNDRHYKKFSDYYGTETSEKYMPNFIVSNQKGHGIPFNPVSQLVKNTGIMLTCYQCERPRLAYCKKNVLPHIVKKFKMETNDLLFTCETTIEEMGDKPSDYDYV